MYMVILGGEIPRKIDPSKLGHQGQTVVCPECGGMIRQGTATVVVSGEIYHTNCGLKEKKKQEK